MHLLLQRLKRHRRRRITGNDEHLDVVLKQFCCRLCGIARDGGRALRAIRQACGIAEIYEILGWHGLTDSFEYR